MKWLKELFSRTNPREAIPEATPPLTPQAWLFELLQGHGLAPSLHEDWVLSEAGLPAIRGTWYPGEAHGQLDIQILVREGVLIEESFGAVGDRDGNGDAALKDGLQNFTLSAFHPLLSALWSRHDPEQVELRSWTVAGRRFSAFIGPIGTRQASGAATPSIPATLLPALEAAIHRESLAQGLHWFSLYVAQLDGAFTFEALKDNAPWSAGAQTLASCGWRPGGPFYSARLFMVLRAVAGEALPG